MRKTSAKRIPEHGPTSQPRMEETCNYDRFRVDLYDLDQFTGPEVGEKAPDFIAEKMNGDKARLSDYRERTVVLVTGSYTSPQYIDKIDTMNLISECHPDVVFLTLYVREAHPGENVPPHRNMEDKRNMAHRTATEDGERAEVLLDDLSGTAHQKYGSLPNMVYIIDAKGTVVAREALNNPRIVEKSLDSLRRGDPPSGIRADFVPVSPLTAVRVLNRAGQDTLNDTFTELPRLVAKHLSASVEEVYRTS